jgi:hypothetical protein
LPFCAFHEAGNQKLRRPRLAPPDAVPAGARIRGKSSGDGGGGPFLIALMRRPVRKRRRPADSHKPWCAATARVCMGGPGARSLVRHRSSAQIWVEIGCNGPIPQMQRRRDAVYAAPPLCESKSAPWKIGLSLNTLDLDSQLAHFQLACVRPKSRKPGVGAFARCTRCVGTR